MSFNLNNYYRKTPRNWKQIGDACLIGIPLISGALMTAPMDETVKLWLIFGCNIALAIMKMVTKFIGDEETDHSDPVHN